MNGTLGAGHTLTMASMAAAPPPPEAQELTAEEMIRYIVQGINNVLGRTYSLVEFDALQGEQLLQVLSDVFGVLSPSARQPLGDVGVEFGANQMRTFLTQTLLYRIPPLIALSFADSFRNADRTVLYPVFYWVLTHMEQSKTRVYLATYLQRPELDQALIAQDDDVRALHQQYEAQRQSFIETHKRVQNLRQAYADPDEARRKATSLQEEKEKLEAYIQVAEKKLGKVPNKDALISASTALRAEMEEEMRLAERKVEQQQQLTSVQQRNSEISSRLQNVRRDASDGRVEAMVRRLKDEMQTNKIKAEDQLPKKIEETTRENEELRKLLTDPLDMQKLTTEDAALDQSLGQLRQKVNDRQKPSDDGSSIATIKQQVQRVTTKKMDVLAELNELQEQKAKVLRDIRAKEQEIAQLRGNSNTVLTGDELRRYTSQVRSKTAATKNMKAKLGELRAEWGVLRYTQSTLQSQFEDLRSEIEELESKMGIRGYTQVSETIEEVTNKKNEVEEIKGKTLEELSRVVQEFTLAVRERQSKLAPQVNKLREVRAEAQQVETEWSEKRSQYEYQESVLKEDISKVEQEVSVLQNETKVNEAVYHQLQSQMVVLDAMLRRAAAEHEFSDDVSKRLSPQYKTYMDFINDTGENLKLITKDLQAKRRDVDENHSTHVQQVEWFNSLKKILEMKLRSTANAATHAATTASPQSALDRDLERMIGGGNRGGGAAGRAGGQSGNNGVDMLVLESN